MSAEVPVRVLTKQAVARSKAPPCRPRPALGIKAVFLAAALAGSATMWMAVIADMGASLLVVFNGLRLLRGNPAPSSIAKASRRLAAVSMRRLLLVVLMLLLPLQWSAALAGSVCGHEADAAHFGHHPHQHDAKAHGHDAGDEPAEDSLGNHPDCDACHGASTACVAEGLAFVPPRADAEAAPHLRRHLPEPPPESLLRPPLILVA